MKQQATADGHVKVTGGGSQPIVFSGNCTTSIHGMKKTKVPGPDGGLIWLVAVVCFLVNMMSSSYARCMGLFFSAFMSTLGVSRAEASLPLSVYNGFVFLSAALIPTYGTRTAATIGGVLITVGLSVSFFARGVAVLVFTAGFLSAALIPTYGTRTAATIGGVLITVGLSVSFFARGVAVLVFTAGFLSVLNSSVVCLTQYFDKRRGAALGLNLAGATIASLLFPKVYEYLLAEYGLHGTFLIIGASMGNVVPLSMILKAPPWDRGDQDRNTIDTVASDTYQKPYDTSVTGASYDDQDKPCLDIKQQSSVPLNMKKTTLTSEAYHAECPFRRATAVSLVDRSSATESRRESTLSIARNVSMAPRRSTLLCCHLSAKARRGTFASYAGEGSASQEFVPDLNEQRARRATMLSVAESLYRCHEVAGQSIVPNAGHSRRATIVSISGSYGLDASTICSDSPRHKFTTYQKEEPATGSLKRNALHVLRNRRFYFHTLSYVSWGVFVDCFISVMFDFAKDAGVAPTDSVHALTIFSATDTVGRLLVPFLSDYNLISNCGLLTIAYLLLSLLQQAAPHVQGKQGVWALAGALGLPSGYIMVGASQILSTEIDRKSLPLAYGLMNTATAIICFIRPLLIGFFRDNYGSYSGLFRFIGGMLAVSFFVTLGLWINGRSKQRKCSNVVQDTSLHIHEPITTIKEEHTYM
ncbi:hypothetical protein HPB50_023028 [Hyalomma asiaticum]|uniref:Uncharacterized protein n=1 Tax=Hyalomma asiaticum TaxID=266040 RepID=A0ACB7SGL9_HYAAI|nr:hypothetical protein HPB50_023028 [Hyalomma asiaticum]